MNPPESAEQRSAEIAVYGELRLRVQGRLRRCFHHELRGALNGAGLQLTLLGRLSSGALDDRPELKARSGDWVEAARAELDALQSWCELSTWLMTPVTVVSAPARIDAATTLRELEVLFSACARHSGTELSLTLPETLSARAVPELFRWVVLDVVTACLEYAAVNRAVAQIRWLEGENEALLELGPAPQVEKISAEALAASGGRLQDSKDGLLRIGWPLPVGA